MTSTASTSKCLFDPERLSSAMDEAGLDAIVAHSHHHQFYLSDIEILDYVISASSADYVVIPRSGLQNSAMTIPMSEWLQMQEHPSEISERIYAGRFYIRNGPALPGIQVPNSFDGLLHTLHSRDLGASRVGFELEHLPVATYQKLVAALPELQIIDATPLLQQLRVIKTDEEIRRIKIACEITEQAIDEASASFAPDMTLNEIAALVATGIVRRGAQILYVQAGAGPTAGLGLPTEQRIRKGEVLRLDVAAIYQGYNSDLGRSFAIGTPDPKYAELYEIAVKAVNTGLAAVQLGRPIEEIYDKAMAVWGEAGITDIRRHHIGHGLGLEAHEAPMIRPGSSEPVAPGMVLAVEVPYYVYQVGGFAPEDVVVVGQNGNTQLTHAPTKLPVID